MSIVNVQKADFVLMLIDVYFTPHKTAGNIHPIIST